MNYLAHLFLSGNDEALQVGNFLGDFVRKVQDVQYPEGIRRGIVLHRKIDTFTDTHPVVREGVQCLRPLHRKYAPVVLDVFYDFLLAKNWDRYSAQTLPAFTQNVYKTLARHQPLMPPVLQQRLPLMIADDWLLRYCDWEGLDFVFNRMKQRASVPAHFDEVIHNLQTHLHALDTGFQQFFPELLAFAKQNTNNWLSEF